jgi:hypothetical protein
LKIIQNLLKYGSCNNFTVSMHMWMLSWYYHILVWYILLGFLYDCYYLPWSKDRWTVICIMLLLSPLIQRSMDCHLYNVIIISPYPKIDGLICIMLLLSPLIQRLIEKCNCHLYIVIISSPDPKIDVKCDCLLYIVIIISPDPKIDVKLWLSSVYCYYFLPWSKYWCKILK